MKRRKSAVNVPGWKKPVAILLLWAGVFWPSEALAWRPLQTMEQAFVNVLNKYRPDLVRKLEKKLDKLEKQLEGRNDLTDERKAELRRNVFAEIAEEARLAHEAAKQHGTPEQAETARQTWMLLLRFADRYVDGASEKLIPTEVEAEFQRLNREREAERQQLRDAQSRDGIAPEHSSAGNGPGGFSIAIGGGFLHASVPKQSYLATDFGGLLTLGVVEQDRDIEHDYWDVALRYAGEFSGFRIAAGSTVQSRTVVDVSFSERSGQARQSLGFFDPGAGTFLGIPGTGDPGAVFPWGISLSDVVSNDVYDLRARYRSESIGGGIRIGEEILLSEWCSFTPFVGFGYRQTTDTQSLGGAVPAWGIDFQYNTRMKYDAFNVDLGGRFGRNLSDMFSIYAEPSVSLNVMDLDGRDELRLSGLVNDVQWVRLKENAVLPGVRLAVGGQFRPADAPFTFSLDGFIAHQPGAVDIHRSGQVGEQSKASFKYATSYGASLGIRVDF